jgi:hypothetical protein
MSFVHYGHSLKLYVYDMDLKVPPGIVKVDANEIVPEADVFLHYGKLTAFSDYFRYEMILKTNEVWADVDTICLSEYFFDDKEYVFIEEASGVYAGGVLKMPSDSELSIFLHEQADRLRFENAKETDVVFHKDFDWASWSYIGPTLLTKAVSKLSLQKHAQPALVINGLDLSTERPYDLFWNPDYRDMMLKRLPSSVSLTFFNSVLDQYNLDKNTIPEGSLMWEFEKKFLKA